MTTQLSADLDQHLLERATALLDPRVTLSEGRRLSGGSGAAVFAVRVDADREAVLKVTTGPDARARLAVEEQAYADPALRGWRPALLAAGQADGVAALLVERLDPRPARPTTRDWTDLAYRLGRLHRLPVPPWLPTKPAAPDLWAALGTWGEQGAGPEAFRAAAWLPQARDWAGAAPVVICHGDCHLDNLVRRAGEPVWIDWAQAHRGPGHGDLVFCWQRAEFAGLRPPRTAMGLAYAAGRGIAADVELQRQLAAAELELLLLAWPPYLGYGDPAARERFGRRLAELADDPVWSVRRAA